MKDRRPKLVIEDAEEAILERDGIEYPVRYGSDLPIEDWSRLLAMRRKMQQGSDDPELMVEVVSQANEMIVNLIREKTPDANLRPFSAPQVAQILVLLSGHEDGPEAATAEALADGERPTGESPSEGDGDGAEESPLASKPRGRKQSSSSATGSNGRPRTGGRRTAAAKP